MVDLKDVKLLAKRELLRCLDELEGSMTLIWDPSLTAPFTLFSELSLLQEHGVEKMVMLPDKGRLAPFPTQLGVFLCSDDIKVIERVCNVIPANAQTEFHLIVVPKLSTIAKKMIKDKGGLKQNDAPGKIKVSSKWPLLFVVITVI